MLNIRLVTSIKNSLNRKTLSQIHEACFGKILMGKALEELQCAGSSLESLFERLSILYCNDTKTISFDFFRRLSTKDLQELFGDKYNKRISLISFPLAMLSREGLLKLIDLHGYKDLALLLGAKEDELRVSADIICANYFHSGYQHPSCDSVLARYNTLQQNDINSYFVNTHTTTTNTTVSNKQNGAAMLNIRLTNSARNSLNQKTISQIHDACVGKKQEKALEALHCGESSLYTLFKRLSVMYFGDTETIGLDFFRTSSSKDLEKLFGNNYNKPIVFISLPLGMLSRADLLKLINLYGYKDLALLLGVKEHIFRVSADTICADNFHIGYQQSSGSSVDNLANISEQNKRKKSQGVDDSQEVSAVSKKMKCSLNLRARLTLSESLAKTDFSTIYELFKNESSHRRIARLLECHGSAISTFLERLSFYLFGHFDLTLNSFKQTDHPVHQLFPALMHKKVSDILIVLSAYAKPDSKEQIMQCSLPKLANLFHTSVETIQSELVLLGIMQDDSQDAVIEQLDITKDDTEQQVDFRPLLESEEGLNILSRTFSIEKPQNDTVTLQTFGAFPVPVNGASPINISQSASQSEFKQSLLSGVLHDLPEDLKTLGVLKT